MWIATNSNGEKVIFNYKPSRYKKPIKVESKEWEEDYHGHFYHPMIDSGECYAITLDGSKLYHKINLD